MGETALAKLGWVAAVGHQERRRSIETKQGSFRGTCFNMALGLCDKTMGCVDIDPNLVSDLDLRTSCLSVLYVISRGNKAWTVRYCPCLNGHSAWQLHWTAILTAGKSSGNDSSDGAKKTAQHDEERLQACRLGSRDALRYDAMQM